MGVGGNSNVSFNKNSDNSPKNLGDINLAETNSASKGANKNESRPERDCSVATAASIHDVGNLNTLFPATGETNEERLTHMMLNVQIFTMLGAIILSLMSLKLFLEFSFLWSFCFFVTTGILVMCCTLGDRRRDWRYIMVIAILSLSVAAYSIARFILVTIAMVDQSEWDDATVKKEGYLSRGVMITVGVIQCIGAVCGLVYWASLAYMCQQLINLMMVRNTDRSRLHQQQQRYHHETRVNVTNVTAKESPRSVSTQDTSIDVIYDLGMRDQDAGTPKP